MTIVERIAEWVSAEIPSGLPDPTGTLLGCVLEGLGAVFLGSACEGGQQVAGYAVGSIRYGGGATVFAQPTSELCTTSVAAKANSAVAAWWSTQRGRPATGSHPHAFIVPTAIAIYETQNHPDGWSTQRPMRRWLQAMGVGYEIALRAREASAANGGSPLWDALGTCACAAHLLEFGRDTVTWALERTLGTVCPAAGRGTAPPKVGSEVWGAMCAAEMVVASSPAPRAAGGSPRSTAPPELALGFFADLGVESRVDALTTGDLGVELEVSAVAEALCGCQRSGACGWHSEGVLDIAADCDRARVLLKLLNYLEYLVEVPKRVAADDRKAVPDMQRDDDLW